MSTTRRIHVIGIGAGSPEHVTAQAAAAIAQVDVFLVADKGESTDELVALRRSICERFVPEGREYEIRAVPDPQRGADAPRRGAAYTAGVRNWHAARADRYAQEIASLPDGAVVGFLDDTVGTVRPMLLMLQGAVLLVLLTWARTRTGPATLTLAGVAWKRLLVAVYMLGGAMAGVAALLMTARINAGHPTAAIGLE